MERLPYEVQVQIFESLTNRDKFTCLLVSKEWQMLVTPCLYNNVKIRNAQNLTTAMTYLEKYSEIANVLQMEFRFCENALCYLPQIQELFPNLNKFVFCGWATDTPVDTSALSSWTSLKELDIKEFLNVDFTTMLQTILSHQCPNLTTLSICNLYIVWNGSLDRSENRLPGMVSLFENAPQLSRLKLEALNCSLVDLEAIHEKAPKLKSLSLSDVNFVGGARPQVFKGKRLSDLHIRFIGTIDENLYTFCCITMKYAGLTSFSVTLDENVHYIMGRDFSIAAEVRLFSKNRQLKYFDQNFFMLNPNIMNEMDRCGIQLEGIKLYIRPDDVELQCGALCNSNQRRSISYAIVHLQYTHGADADQLEIQALRLALESLANFTNLTDLAIQSTNRTCLTELTRYLITVPRLLKISLRNIEILRREEDDIQKVEIDLPIKKIEIRDLEISLLEYYRVVSVVMRELLPHCPDLEEFILDMSTPGAYEGIPIALDFRQNPKLKSIVINPENKIQYCIIQNMSTASGGYFWYDDEYQLLEEVEYLDPNYYTTTILVSQPVMLNSCYVEINT